MLSDLHNRFSIAGADSRRILRDIAIPINEANLTAHVGSIPHSYERAVLASLEYNGLLANSGNLRAAITAGIERMHGLKSDIYLTLEGEWKILGMECS